MTLIECAYYDGIVYLKELYYKSEKLPSDLVDFMKAKNISKSDIIYPDPSRPDSSSQLRKAGYNVHKTDNTILDGLKALKEHCLHIVGSSTNMLRERRFYRWKVDKNGKPLDDPEDIENHSWDAARYAVYNNPVIRHRKELYK